MHLIVRTIEKMFNGGLSQTLIQTLTKISNHIPTLQQPIQDRLARSVWTILVNNAHSRLEEASNATAPTGANDRKLSSGLLCFSFFLSFRL